MALKRKKLDAICAHLKKTSAVDVNATTQNGVNGDVPFANGAAPKDVAKPASTTNNNEETAADLNETTPPDPHPSNDSDWPQVTSSDGGLCFQHSSSEGKSPCVVTTPDGSSTILVSSTADVSVLSCEPENGSSVPLPLASASSSGLSGSGRRKSRKAAKPRLVFQAPEQFDSGEDEIHDTDEVFSRVDSVESSLATKEANGLHSTERLTIDSLRDARSPPPLPSGFATQYSLQKPPPQPRQQQNESIGSLASLSPSSSPSGSNLSSVPLDLSTSRTSDQSENHSADASFFHNEDDDTDNVSTSTRPSTAVSSPAPAQAAPMAVSAEAEGLADYAANTMNELLSIYGFGAAGVEGGDRQGVSKQQDLSLLSPQTPTATGTGKVRPVPPAHQGGGSGGVKAKPMYHSQALQNALLSVTDSLSQSEGVADASPRPAGEGSKSCSAGSNPQPTKLKFHNVKPVVKQVPGNSGAVHKVSSSDYNKYIKKFHNGTECGGSHCGDLGYKDHYHCHDCNFKVFVKKEEMVRHYKWHRKRDESLQHGFLRYSPLDDCGIKFGNCTHNKRQTHYHCIQSGCDKVYISTSDVQMHANYHRKDSAIIQEGFQRFRATEDCGTTTCSFYGQRTTHFHCRRSNCNFTFKHKADMEKHKSYHQKDEILGRDGFKKFMKYEHCSYNGCRFSKISNHIHCIRPGCNYVLHSTAQLYSHKRKHERREFENLYRTYRQIQRPSIQPSSSQVQSSPGPQAPNIATGLPTTAIPLVSKVNLTSIPLQGYGEPLVARPVVGGQIRLPLPLALDGRAGAVMAPNVSVVSAGAQTMSIVSTPTTTVAQPLALTTTHKSSTNTASSTTHKTESIQAVTLLPQPHQTHPHKAEPAPTLTSKPQPIRIKQEPKSDVESDAESLSSSQNCRESSASCGPGSRLEKVEEEDLNSSLNLSVSSHQPPQLATQDPVTAGDMKSMSNIKVAATVKSTLDASIGVDTSSLASPVITLRPPMRKVGAPEKRERDESWKNYLIRYTANDPCHSRCSLLYKDHYHCKIPGCQVLFRSKDGVREHAKFHDLQERITPMVYKKYNSTQACPSQGCQYSMKQTHYHCNWTNCKHVIVDGGQTFARLEHYRIHEYAKVSAGKNYRTHGGAGGPGRVEGVEQRRRGRPPKYPRMDPVVPKVELTEQEIQESLTKTGEREEKVVNGFKRFDSSSLCPDAQCVYRSQVHYHCGRPRCHTTTDRVDALNLHAKDFHSFVNILDNFEFFDRNVNCRRGHCSNNRTNHHFHCTYPRCDYSFVRHSTMAQHYKKHHGEMNAVVKPLTPTSTTPKSPATPLSPGTRVTPIQLLRRPDGQTYIPIVPAPAGMDKNVVKAAGTFYPLSGLPAAVSATSVSMVNSQGQPLTSALTLTIPASLVSTAIPVMAPMTSGTMVTPTSNIVPVIAGNIPGNLLTGTLGTAVSTAPPLTVLLQQKSDSPVAQPSWSAMRSSMHYSLQASCGRPFCKLKKKDHYHCLECNQAFSDPARLRGHISKHGVKFKKLSQAPCSAVSTVISKEQVPQHDPTVVGLDLSTSKVREANTIPEKAPQREETVEEGAVDDNDSLSSSLNLSMGKITNCLVPQNNSIVDLSEHNSGRLLVIDEQNSRSDNESAEAEIGMNGNDEDDEGLSDRSLSASTSLTSSPTMSRRSGRKRSAPNHSDFVPSDDASLVAKQMKLKLSAPIPCTIAATPIPSRIPEGFIRIKCGTDCCYTSCNYRHSVSHFHCLRPECGYGFSDKSRMENHLDRHKRLDKLMGEEFRQFRATVSCGRGDCEFSKKASHFHCEKCAFVCADSSKVLAHRKYHAKMDNISKNGFQKSGALQACGVLMCSYSRKQTHYHCTHEGCNHAVLGPAQMAPHKLKHASHVV
ncbi:zinc finger protein castor homolog 1-like [Babylonia areolata]|uniref:zinc finger protein castor homolog 1-like n=1 Tax=Babylonia areolata TaxID=304850 RepID=UPI003FD10359